MKKLFFILVLIICSCSVWGNGDPVVQLSALLRSANPTARPIPDIKMLSETLIVTPGIFTTVQVRYVLWNSSSIDYMDIDYGFPVDYQGGGKDLENSDYYDDGFSESSYTAGWKDKYVQNLSFSINSKMLPVTCSEETMIRELDPMPDRAGYHREDESPETYEENEFYYENDVRLRQYTGVFRRWFYIRFSIPAGETILLEVNYSLFPGQQHRYGSDSKITEGFFHYDLSPASNWGNGITREIHMVIDTTELVKDKWESIWLKNDSIPFIPTNKGYEYRAVNYNFATSPLLEFTFRAPMDSELIPESEIILANRINSHAYTITTNHPYQGYPPENMKDMDLNTTWAAKNNGKDTEVRILFKEPTTIGGLSIIPGYHKNEKTYMENSRPSHINMLFYGRFTKDGEIYTRNYSVHLKDSLYEPVYLLDMTWEKVGLRAAECYPFPYMDQIVLTFPEVYPGSKYEDLCISEILLFSSGPNGTN